MRTKALKLHKAGFSVIPVNGNKKPTCGSWAPFQKRQPTNSELVNFDYSTGIALVGGKGLFCIDLDVKYDKTGLISKFKQLVNQQDKNLLQSLFCEKTPSGGWHLVGKCKKPIGNLKLAKDKAQVEACIETRGDGGYFVVSPSKGYVAVKGDLCKLPEIEPNQLDIIINSAKSLNYEKPKVYKPNVTGTELTPLDDYDRKHNYKDIERLLLEVGWKNEYTKDETIYMSRPGKEDKGCSASINHYPNMFWCWSSNTPFESYKSYTPSMVLAVIKYGGDFKACVKDLANQGYGVKAQVPKLKPLETADLSEIEKTLLSVSNGQFQHGLFAGWDSLKDYYRIANFQLNIVTGIPTHGKSTWVDQLMVQLANLHGWRFLVYSPESYPLDMHWRSLAEKLLRQNVYGINKESVKVAADFISEHFVFVDCSKDDIVLDGILELAKKNNVNGLLIDPYNEISFERPNGMTETDFVGLTLKKVRTFSRNNKIATWIVAHPQKQYKDDKGKYRVPTLYDISGSAHFYNKADNGIVIYRNSEKECEVHIEKIKLRTYGERGMVKLKYEEDWRGYEDYTTKDEINDYLNTLND